MHALPSPRPAAVRLPAARVVCWAALLLSTLLVGCASRSPSAGGFGAGRDGPEAHPPSDLAQRPDAEPKWEAIRPGGPNKPYEIGGISYVPLAQDLPFQERGLASWYGTRFHGLPTASGEPYDMYAMTAAHPTLPIPSYARIRNPANGRQVIVRINDRGPFHPGRIVDLSYTAALKLDLLRGTRPVELERITFDDIRTGAWRRDPAPPSMPIQLADAGRRGTAAAVSAVPLAAALPPPVPVPAPSSVPVTSDTPAGAAAPGVAPAFASVSPVTRPEASARAIGDAMSAGAVGAGAGARTGAGPGWWVQLGAFRQQDGAVAFRQRVGAEVDGLMPLLTVVADAALFKLQAGPYANRQEADEAAGRLRPLLQLVPLVVERR